MESSESSGEIAVGSNSRVVLAPKWLGKRVGRFKLLALLGQGAMGRVFRAEDTLMQRHVALKMLPRAVKRGSTSVGAEMLIREARAAASIEHPGAVQIYEINEAGDAYYIAMELLEGGSLRDLVKAAGPMDPTRACLLAAEAAETLAYAHSVGVIHRDVKPANLMLNRAGRCKVVDFGLARIDDPSNLTSFLAESVGTPQFIAPEILTGTPASAQSDIYSLAGTVWYLLTGHPPFEAGTSQELLQRHLYSNLVDLKSLRPEVPQDLADALAKGLEKTPSARYASMDQFAKVLRVHTIPIAGSATNLEGIAVPSSTTPTTSRRPLTPLDSVPVQASGNTSEDPRAEESTKTDGATTTGRRLKMRVSRPVVIGASVLLFALVTVACIILVRLDNSHASESGPSDNGLNPNPAAGRAKSFPGPIAATEPATVPALVTPSSNFTTVRPDPFVAQWIADDYEIGRHWVDRQHHLVAKQKNFPSLIENAFNGHRGILLNGKDQYFVFQPGESPRLGGRSMTIVVVFKPNAESKPDDMVRNVGLIGDKQKSGMNDWLVAWGGSTGHELIAGAGNFPPPDSVRLYSKALDPSRAHVAIVKWLFLADEAAEAKLVLVVDGIEVARALKSSELRSEGIPIAIGALSADGAMPFNGLLAEVRLYDDIINDPPALSERLLKLYANESTGSSKDPSKSGLSTSSVNTK